MVGKYNQNWNYFHFELKANAFFFFFFFCTLPSTVRVVVSAGSLRVLLLECLVHLFLFPSMGNFQCLLYFLGVSF